MYTPVILTDTADLEAIRDFIGVPVSLLSNTALMTETFLGQAETFLTLKLISQLACPTVAQIMAGTFPATAKDKVLLKAATVAYVAYLFSSSTQNTGTTKIATGDQSVEIGSGKEWKQQGQEWIKACNNSLILITGWKEWRDL
jgi:hypothetical protein